MLFAVTSAKHGSLHCSTHPIMITHFVALQLFVFVTDKKGVFVSANLQTKPSLFVLTQKRITKNVVLLILDMFSCVHRLGTQPLTKGNRHDRIR